MKTHRCSLTSRVEDDPEPEPEPLPDPVPMLENLARGALEVLAGVREVEQLARWLSEEAYLALLQRSQLATRARHARGVGPRRPAFRVHALHYSCPVPEAVEAALVVTTPARTRAIAIRLETVPRSDGDGLRWHATSLAIL